MEKFSHTIEQKYDQNWQYEWISQNPIDDESEKIIMHILREKLYVYLAQTKNSIKQDLTLNYIKLDKNYLINLKTKLNKLFLLIEDKIKDIEVVDKFSKGYSLSKDIDIITHLSQPPTQLNSKPITI